MTFVLYTCIVSPHQLEIAKLLANASGVDFYYIYTEKLPEDATKRGWSWLKDEKWMIYRPEQEGRVAELLLSCDVLLSGLRIVDVFKARLAAGKKTLYMSERWFKPIKVVFGKYELGSFPGWVRLFVPNFWKMARQFASFFKSEHFIYFPMGVWAASDMRLVCRVNGVHPSDTLFIPWGYFVAPSTYAGHSAFNLQPSTPLKVLWVGRMLDWKRVDTIIRAVEKLNVERLKVELTLVGQGPMREQLMKMAEGLPVTFVDGVPIKRVRELMHEHDVYVLSSDAGEGWGAALSEALEEGMIGLGTFEAGSSATMLPDSHKFHAGDYRRLAHLLIEVQRGHIKATGVGEWSAKKAIGRLLNLIGVENEQ